MSGALGSGGKMATDERNGGCGGRYRRILLLLGLGATVMVGVGLVAVLALGWTPGPPWGGPYPLFWPLFPLGFFLVALLVISAARWAWWGARGEAWGRYGGYGPPRARELLRERYVRGEITREQFREMRRELEEAD